MVMLRLSRGRPVDAAAAGVALVSQSHKELEHCRHQLGRFRRGRPVDVGGVGIVVLQRLAVRRYRPQETLRAREFTRSITLLDRPS